MAEYTANPIQLVAVAGNVLFTEEPVVGGCAIIHREGSGLINLRGQTNQCRARFQVLFSGNLAVPTGETVGPISLALAIDGEAVGPSTMISTPAAVDEYNNVSSSVFIDVPRGSNYTVGVRNTSPIPINVQNANLIVTRVA